MENPARERLGSGVVRALYYLDGRYLIDGGITNPLPTDILVENDIDFVIFCSVNFSFSLSKSLDSEAHESGHLEDGLAKYLKPSPKYGIVRTLTRTIGIMSASNTLNKARLADIDIRPNVSHIDWTDFHRGDELLHAGEEAAEEAMPAIQELLRRQ